MSILGQGASLWLPLRTQFPRPSGVELLRDGNMEEVGIAAWTVVNNVTTKEPVAPYLGTQCIRLSFDGVNALGFTRPAVNILVSGLTYRVRGKARSNGVSIPSLSNGVIIPWVGTTSTSWQDIDVTFDNTGTEFRLRCTNLSAGNYVEFDMMSVQQVIQVTLDIGDYTSRYTYLLSDTGGATECAGLRKLDLIDRHTGARTTLADFSASPGAGAVCTLPSGWSYSCNVAGRRTQVGPNNNVDVAANAPAWFSGDGVNGALSVPCKRTNSIWPSDTPNGNLGSWSISGSGTITANFAAGPNGLAHATRVTGVSGQWESVALAAFTTGTATLSGWWKRNGGGAALQQRAANNSGNGSWTIAGYGASWVFSSKLITGATINVVNGFDHRVAQNPSYDGNAVDVLSCDFQVEEGLYPSERITTTVGVVTRPAAILAAPHDQVAFDSGKIPELIWVPAFAYNETSVDCVILDDSRGRLWFEQATQKFCFSMYGRGTIKSLACTFSREQAITLRADVDGATQIATLIVSGATTGNGTFQTYFQAQKAVMLGDGYTSTSFPTQLTPRGLLFDGGDWIECPYPYFIDFVANYTFFLFIQRRLPLGSCRLMTRANLLTATARQYDLYYNGTGDTHFVQGGVDMTTTPLTAANDSLMSIAVTVDSSLNGIIYWNGVAKGTVVMGTANRSNDTFRSYIGDLYRAGSPSYRPFTGRLMAVMAYAYVQNPTQIKALHDRCLLECNR